MSKYLPLPICPAHIPRRKKYTKIEGNKLKYLRQKLVGEGNKFTIQLMAIRKKIWEKNVGKRQ